MFRLIILIVLLFLLVIGYKTLDVFMEGFNLKETIQSISYVGLFAIVFAESGLLIGFFLPGDSLLFTAGLLASQNLLNLPVLIVSLSIAAVAGDSVGYTFGRKVGSKIFNRDNSWLFHKDHLRQANEFYEKHGGKTIILARFMPLIRTFAPIVAGVGEMNYSRFLSFNVFGGVFWVVSMCSAGYFLGNVIPDIDKYLLPVIGVIVLLSILPGVRHFHKENPKFFKEKILPFLKGD